MPRVASTAAVRAAGPGRASAHRQITTEYVESLKAYAGVLYLGGLAPKGCSRPEAVAAIIEVGRDVGLAPTQALAAIKIVAGRPSIYGDAALALVRASGLLEDVEETYDGEPGTEGYTAVCRTKRVGAKRDRITRFSIFDAMRANLWLKAGPWTEYPERMLMWRARGWNLRDEFGDVLCGLITVEEAEDIPTARVVKTTSSEPVALPAASTTGSSAAEPDPSSGRPDRAGITDAQLDRLVDLRDSMWAGKGCRDDESRDLAWAEVLADFGVTSALALTGDQADELILTLGKTYDPFTHPPTAPDQST